MRYGLWKSDLLALPGDAVAAEDLLSGSFLSMVDTLQISHTYY